MKSKFTNLSQSQKALELIAEMSEECPYCGSTDIHNERETDMAACDECASQFDFEDTTKQNLVVRTLRLRGLSEAADEIDSMSPDEYSDFLCDYIY